MAERTLRPIVVIDEEKCNGCGQCVSACAESALAIIDGKARLISDVYCDGLGACLGECPQGAITVQERAAAAFDEAAVAVHLGTAPINDTPVKPAQHLSFAHPVQQNGMQTGCPGSMARTLRTNPMINQTSSQPAYESQESSLGNWPIQLSLLPVSAPYLQNANLLVSADCVAFALPDFHRRFLSGRVLTIGCPKLDDTSHYVTKLTELFRRNNIESVQVLYMEVPCCTGIVRTVQAALAAAGKQIPCNITRVGIDGEVQESRNIA